MWQDLLQLFKRFSFGDSVEPGEKVTEQKVKATLTAVAFCYLRATHVSTKQRKP